MAIAHVMPLALTLTDPAALMAALPGGPGRFLLESGPSGPHDVRRISLAGAEPFLTLSTKGRTAHICEEGLRRTVQGDPLTILQELLDRCHLPTPPGFTGVAGAAVGYFGYDLFRQIESFPDRLSDEFQLPDIQVGFYDVLLALDHESGRTSLLIGPPEGREVQAARKAGRWADALRRAAPLTPPRPQPAASVHSNCLRSDYIRSVEHALAYIGAGDIYQVNLSQRFTCPYSGSGWDLYRRLREINPAPFAAYLDMGQWQVVSGSPERFITVRGNRIETRPIKGTRPRGVCPEEDSRTASELMTSQKDAAELVMIVDLQRNDLGRVCDYGSVSVPDLRRLEATPNVWHTVATVEGRLRPHTTASDILRATFPGGSITGAPKVRAMQIIEELETVRRGVYTGAIGYIGFDGQIDLNIAIRTAVVHGRQVAFHAGGGIVADSDPEAEWAESLAKGSGIARALGVNLNDLP